MDNSKSVISIGNVDIPYEIRINKKLKYMRLSMDINGIKVSLPCKIDLKEIERFLKSKSQWIYKHYMDFQAANQIESKRQWVDGEEVLLKGNNFTMKIEESDKNGARASFDGEEFIISVNKYLDDEKKKEIIEEVVRGLYIKMARDIINERLVYYSGIIGVLYNDVRIKEQKTRWGSCSKKRNLNFNWKIIMAPQLVIDYVIVHELCHLKHLNHSKQFWDMVEGFMPDYKKLRQWLKVNGKKLIM